MTYVDPFTISVGDIFQLADFGPTLWEVVTNVYLETSNDRTYQRQNVKVRYWGCPPGFLPDTRTLMRLQALRTSEPSRVEVSALRAPNPMMVIAISTMGAPDPKFPWKKRFKIGDYARHPSHPGWIFQLLSCHNNPNVGWWTLEFKLPGAVWPRPYGIPDIGSLHELGYGTLDLVSEMELIALAITSE